MKTILGYLRPHAPRVAVGVTVKFTAAVLELLLPLLLAHIIDGCVPARDLPGVFRAGGWMLVMAFGAAGSKVLPGKFQLFGYNEGSQDKAGVERQQN